MKQRYYSIASLEAEIREYEERFALSTSELYAANKADALPDGITPFDATVWIAKYFEAKRLRAQAELPTGEPQLAG